MARVLTASAPASERDDLGLIENWYRRKLAEPVEMSSFRWNPVYIGPTWQTELVNGKHYWVLPERTLGWAGLTFCGRWLQVTRGEPWRFTLEQARWWLWWYSLDHSGRWTFRDGVLQRLKGWGKDPIGATLGMNELVGPCRLEDWVGDQPVATDCADAWVQLAAVSLKQTKNTMKLLPGMITPAAKEQFKIQVQREQVYALGDTRFLEAITSSPETLEGARGTFVLLNEAMALDTPLPTPTGWTSMKSVQVGDHLIGSDGSPTRVVYVTDPQYDRDCYRVSFADGTSVIASDGHLWQTKVSESAAKPRVRSTADMVADGRRFRVPRAGALRTPDIDLPVDPYVLGLWLGDGGSTAPIITASDEDIEEVESLVRARGYTVQRNKAQQNKAARFTVSREGARRNRNDFRTKLSLRAELQAAGVLGDKHVPDVYLRAGYQQRLDLLRGLMDSDGCASKAGHCIFVNNSAPIADAITELLRSLGQRVGRTWAPDARSRAGGAHRVVFTPKNLMPFGVARKAARVRPAKPFSDWLSITSIEPVESVPVKCVEVAAEDHLFLAGEGWTVTHNTHHWQANNSGHDMADVIARNTTKSPGGTARTLRITNAYEPGEDSIAERDRDAYEAMRAAEKGTAGATRLLYDSIEAAPEAPLSAEAAPEVVETIRGDSSWLDVQSIVDFIQDVRNPPSKSRRFWYNQITAAEDAWMSPQEWDAIGDRDQLVLPDEPIVAFFDGSKSDDTTGLVGCRISDGHVFRVGSWSKPAGERGKGWIVPRDEVDKAVTAMFDSYAVRAFFADPSDARDDEGERFWEPLVDQWHRTFGRELQVWAMRSGDRTHSIAWAMGSSERQEAFTNAAMRFCTEVKAATFTHDGDLALRMHVLNARRRPNKWGVTLGKEHRESARKVDLAVCAVGARMLRRLVLNKETGGKKPRSGKVWGSY